MYSNECVFRIRNQPQNQVITVMEIKAFFFWYLLREFTRNLCMEILVLIAT